MDDHLIRTKTNADWQDAVGAESAKFGQGKAFKNKWIVKGENDRLVKQVPFLPIFNSNAIYRSIQFKILHAKNSSRCKEHIHTPKLFRNCQNGSSSRRKRFITSRSRKAKTSP